MTVFNLSWLPDSLFDDTIVYLIIGALGLMAFSILLIMFILCCKCEGCCRNCGFGTLGCSFGLLLALVLFAYLHYLAYFQFLNANEDQILIAFVIAASVTSWTVITTCFVCVKHVLQGCCG